MKKLLSLLLMFTTMLFIASCGDDDDDDNNDDNDDDAPATEVDVSGTIDEDTEWTADQVYVLNGRVIVTEGATLTIAAGTIVKGEEGQGTNASVLMAAVGGRIVANGTAAAPIIFTSVLDDIEPGQLSGTNLDEDDEGLWGGLVLLGDAPISPEAGTTDQIEGIPAGETLGQYGGSDATDDSGTLRYISIRHGGTTIDAAAGNDINGLTLGGVGSGTTISNVEILANLDDGIEFFGGTVSVTNLLVVNQGDDAVDVDMAWSGTLTNFWVVLDETVAGSDEGLEIDGPEGSENDGGKFNLTNGTIVSNDGGGSAADFKSRAQGTVTNVKWEGFTGGATLKFRASFDDESSCADKTDAYSNATASPADLVITGSEFGAAEAYDGDDEDACDLPAGHQTTLEGVVTSTTATGGDASAFADWTWSSINGTI